ncbi:MAG: T9SS type A sorting domain-containing protein [Bacteroidetes bacterium]|nr:T9SS type A sorting domain-containing protein [Bacteroidota bacterium]
MRKIIAMLAFIIGSVAVAEAQFSVVITASDTSVCECDPIQLSANVYDGIPPFSYAWLGPDLASCVGQFTFSSPCNSGAYILTVTDSLGNTVTDSIYIHVIPKPNVTLCATPNPICPGECTTITASGADEYAMPVIGVPYSTNNTFVVCPTISTTYPVNGMNGGQCWESEFITISMNPCCDSISASIDDTEVCQGESITFSSYGANSILWSPSGLFNDNTDTITVTPTISGTYQCTLTNGTGCQIIRNFSILVHSQSEFLIPDTVCPNEMVAIENICNIPPGHTSIWDFDGAYVLSGSGNGPFEVTWTTPGIRTITRILFDTSGLAVDTSVAQCIVFYLCYPNEVSGRVFHDLNNNQSFDSGDIPLQHVIISSGNGYDFDITDSAGFYTVLADTGNATVELGYMSPYITYTPSQYTHHFNGVGQSETGYDFSLYAQAMNPDAEISLYLDGCFYSWGWPQPGFPHTINISISNQGTSILDGNVKLIFDTVLTVAGTSEIPFAETDSTLGWNYFSLQPGEMRSIKASFNVPANFTPGNTLRYQGMISTSQTDINPGNNTNIYFLHVWNSNDPNDIHVNRTEMTPAEVSARSELVYRIRFQNTGTAPARFIRILDTIPENVQPGSIRILDYSHSMTWDILPHGVLEFFFDSIMLPDSTADEPNSHGYVVYAVQPDTTLQLLDEIHNTAYIYFDYNTPVITNTAITYIKDTVNNVKPLEIPETGFSLYPNPAGDMVYVNFDLESDDQISISLIDVTGRKTSVLHNSKMTAGMHNVPLRLPENLHGVYIVEMRSNRGAMCKRLIIK